MHVYIITTQLVDDFQDDGTELDILQVMDSPRGAFEAMREHAVDLDADIEKLTATRWRLTERETDERKQARMTHIVESVRKPVMSFNAAA